MRQYLVGSWANADTYDYSGEMLMGNRHGASRRAHFTTNGAANVQAYGDDVVKKHKRSVRDKLVPQQVRLNNIEKYMRELEDEYDNGEISTEEYIQLYRIAEKKHKRAYELLARAYGWSEQNDSQNELKDEEPIEEFNYTSYNESPIVSSTAQEIFSSLSDGNVFKIAYMKIKRIAEALK